MAIPLDKLSPAFEDALEHARLFAEERKHANIAPEHLLFVLFDEDAFLSMQLAKTGVSTTPLLSALTAKINLLPKNTLDPGRRPVASRALREMIEKSFTEMEARGAEIVEPADFVLAVCAHAEGIARDLRAAGVTRETLTVAQKQSKTAREVLENGPGAPERTSAPGKLLARFTRDLTALARSGELMPVVGRDE
jgi:ATP-dependent Clp protease ATP-binding subunit ClpB